MLSKHRHRLHRRLENWLHFKATQSQWERIEQALPQLTEHPQLILLLIYSINIPSKLNLQRAIQTAQQRNHFTLCNSQASIVLQHLHSSRPYAHQLYYTFLSNSSISFSSRLIQSIANTNLRKMNATSRQDSISNRLRSATRYCL